MSEITTRSMYLLHTSAKGESSIREHFVWNGDRFFSSQLQDAKKEGGTVTMVSKEDYVKQRTHNKTFK